MGMDVVWVLTTVHNCGKLGGFYVRTAETRLETSYAIVSSFSLLSNHDIESCGVENQKSPSNEGRKGRDLRTRSLERVIHASVEEVYA
jgi:hypothetical protein